MQGCREGGRRIDLPCVVWRSGWLDILSLGVGMERCVCRATRRKSNPGSRIRDLSVGVLDAALTG